MRRFLLTTLCLAVALALVPALPAHGDVIHLRTGEAIKGRPVPHQSDEQKLVIVDYLSGATRTLVWDVVDPADRDRLQREWGWANNTQRIVEGDVIIQRLSAGSTAEVRGMIQSEDETHVTIMSNGQTMRVNKDQIVERRKDDMDPRNIWSPEQLYARFLDELRKKGIDVDNMTVRIHWRAGQYSEWADLLEKARDHYEVCANDPAFMQAQVAKGRLENVEALLRDKEALQTIRLVKAKLSLRSFRRVREILAGFAEAHPDTSELVLVQVERLNTRFKQDRDDYFQGRARTDFVRTVKKLIEAKVKEKDIGLTDATAWTRRELPEEAFAALAVEFQKTDDVTPEEAQVFWERRKKRSWSNAGYGSGTFIVKPAEVKPPSSRRGGGGGRGGGGAGPVFKPPKPPTRDQWWAKANTRDRASWVLAYFVENSGLFEVKEEPKRRPCRTCNGEGLESMTSQAGGTMYYLCTRCGGARYDISITFR